MVLNASQHAWTALPIAQRFAKLTTMRVALGQINTTVGDLEGNTARMIEYSREAAKGGAELIVFPELAICGYPPRDLVERQCFISRNLEQLHRLAAETAALNLSIVAGYVGSSDAATGKRATNRAAVVRGGSVVFDQIKVLLPTYDVFDEARYFASGGARALWREGRRNVAVAVCEDAWNDKQFWEQRLYSRDPVEELMELGGDLLVSINASPFQLGKRELRRQMFATTTRRFQVPAIVVNQVGGNDSLVFDGSSFVMNAQGEQIAVAKSFEEDLVFADLEQGTGDQHANFADEDAAVYEALVLGTRDYIRKCGFSKVLIGFSGGIDSSLTAAIAVDAVGAENVTGVGMPGPYSSSGSVSDSRALAQNLGVRFEISPITTAYEDVVRTLAPLFVDYKPNVTEENLQSRLRGVTLMALSNKFNALVLTTGNKSEIAVGYCTLYGDMCGGLAVISDVPKTLVYKLSRVANQRHAGAIPESVFEKAPSAELRADQKDTDSLPEYETLDAILHSYIEEYRSPSEIAAQLKLPLDLVMGITTKVDRNEYKRQQAAPGLKVTTKAFGIGRRFPIAQRYSE
jgi:NAD+ synthase (glutamine-hydrolysing)